MTVARATTPVPRPVAIDDVVTNDVVSRTLIVRRPETASGYGKLLWREAHQALVSAAESGWRTAHPYVWGGALGNRQIVHGQPGDYLTLLFCFRPVSPFTRSWSAHRAWPQLSRRIVSNAAS